ncbi:MAG: hypothetical protein ACKPKO_13420, partial [Candidatus Fonsibacter sp.]
MQREFFGEDFGDAERDLRRITTAVTAQDPIIEVIHPRFIRHQPPSGTVAVPPEAPNQQGPTDWRTTDTTWNNNAFWQSKIGQRRRPPPSVAATDLDPVESGTNTTSAPPTRSQSRARTQIDQHSPAATEIDEPSPAAPTRTRGRRNTFASRNYRSINRKGKTAAISSSAAPVVRAPSTDIDSEHGSTPTPIPPQRSRSRSTARAPVRSSSREPPQSVVEVAPARGRSKVRSTLQ